MRGGLYGREMEMGGGKGRVRGWYKKLDSRWS
jgi:hypothetical protein